MNASKAPVPSFDSKDFLQKFPDEVKDKIIAKLATDSVKGLFQLMQNCKTYYRDNMGEFVSKHVSFDNMKFIDHHMCEEFMVFLKRCGEAGNTPALFYLATLELLDWENNNFEVGVEYLKEAARKEHEDAKYIYATYLYCAGSEEERAEEFHILSNMTHMQLIEAREKFIATNTDRVGMIWGSSNHFLKAISKDYFIGWNEPLLPPCNQCGNVITSEVPHHWEGWNIFTRNVKIGNARRAKFVVMLGSYCI